jgi:hypothetical protein
VLGTSGDGSRPLSPYLFLDILGGTASVHILRLGRLGNYTIELIGSNQLTFTFVPRGQDLDRGGASQDARMDKTSKSYSFDVSA